MQGCSGRLATPARQVGIVRWCGPFLLLTLAFATSACVGGGQIANLIDSAETSVAIEAASGPPPTVRKLVESLAQEAAARHVVVTAPSQSKYRLRAYLAVQSDGDKTAMSWALDVYDVDQSRAFRVSGEEKAPGALSEAANDEAVQRIARAGMQQFVNLATADRMQQSPPIATWPLPNLLPANWTDDWAPEASGIFRIFQRTPARPEIAADVKPPQPSDQIPLPRSRPAPTVGTPGAAFAFAAEDD